MGNKLEKKVNSCYSEDEMTYNFFIFKSLKVSKQLEVSLWETGVIYGKLYFLRVEMYTGIH